jgi:hypothetical protein
MPADDGQIISLNANAQDLTLIRIQSFTFT